jgi:hypothetical protein
VKRAMSLKLMLRDLWWTISGCDLVDLPCGCQDVVTRRGKVVDREHDHVQCDGTPL